MTPTLYAVARQPEMLEDLSVAQLAAIIAAASAKVLEKAGVVEAEDCIALRETANLLKMHPKTVARLSRVDPRYRRLRVETGTARVIFNRRRVLAFIARGKG